MPPIPRPRQQTLPESMAVAGLKTLEIEELPKNLNGLDVNQPQEEDIISL